MDEINLWHIMLNWVEIPSIGRRSSIFIEIILPVEYMSIGIIITLLPPIDIVLKGQIFN